jgi:peptide/nickel transport system substrate-binding protein
MVRRVTSWSVAVLVVAGLCVFASSAADAASASKPVHGGTMVYSSQQDLSNGSIDPAVLNNGADSWIGTCVFDRLAYVSYPTGKVVYVTAQSLTPTSAAVWTLKLKPGIKFTNGEAYDANAVMVQWQRDANSPVLKSFASGMSLQVVDPLTLKITLSTPNSAFPINMATNLELVMAPSQNQAEGNTFPYKPVSNPIGAGPFTVQSYTRGSEIVMTRNPNYWDKPRPYVNGIDYKIIADVTSRYNSLVAGQIQIMTASFGAYPTIQQAQQAGYKTVLLNQPIGGQTIILNTTKAPFNNVIARQAFYEAINLKAMNKTVNLGYNSAPTTLFPKGSPFYTNAPFPKYNPTNAQKLINQYAQQTGGPLTFDISTATVLSPAQQFLQAEMNAYQNVHVTASIINPAQFVQIALQLNFTALMGMTTSGYNVQPTVAACLNSTSSFNFGKYNNPAVDQALTTGSSTTNTQDQAKAYATLSKDVAADVPYVFYTRTQDDYVMGKTVRGLVYSATNNSGAPLPQYFWLTNG